MEREADFPSITLCNAAFLISREWGISEKKGVQILLFSCDQKKYHAMLRGTTCPHTQPLGHLAMNSSDFYFENSSQRHK